MVFFAEAYFAGLVRETVFDPSGRRLGPICDIFVKPNPRSMYPVISKVAVQLADRRTVLIPWHCVRSASYEGFRLAMDLERAAVEAPDEEDVSVRRRLLDRQIIDVSGKRVVRVHDLKFGGVGHEVLLTHVDIGWRGLLRRLNFEHFTLGVCRLVGARFPERLIAWEHVQMPSEGDEIHVDASRDALRKMPPEDLADIAEKLSVPERASFLGAMDEEVAADALQEMEPEAQVSVVQELSNEQASDIIEEMDPDAGADLLADLPESRADAILNLMEPDEAADLRELMRHSEDSAGGLMTVEYVAVPQGVTAGEALERLRAEATEVATIYYVYVIDAEERLMGVFSLRELVVASPDTPVAQLMETEVHRVGLDTPQDDIAHIVAHYDLLAVPVVDGENRLRGIVTMDDAIDQAIPTSWKKRIPKVFGR
jgi:CBS domain-containing protein/sporulation protein YlmC with PRC-barrel domain